MANLIPPGLGEALGLVDINDSWEDRIREAAYTPPGGLPRLRFDFEEVRREYELRGTVFEFPGVDNAYVQQRGVGPRLYPMRCYFAGREHDRIATAFELGLLEPGVGKLEHPMYGPVEVVPLGRVTRRNDLVREANQSVIDVTFYTTTGVVYPRAVPNAKNEIEAALGNFDAAAAQDYQASVDFGDAVKRANAKATIKAFLRDTSAALQSASDSVAAVRREFQDIEDTINLGLDVLIGQPLLLAQQCVNLVRAPARAVIGIESRLAQYQALANRIIDSAAGAPGEALAAGTALAQRVLSIANDFRTADLFAMASVTGSSASALSTTFRTRREALTAAASVQSQADTVTAWRDDGFTDLQALDVSTTQIDTGAASQAFGQVVSATVGYLVQASFSLVPELEVVLDRPRTIIDLAAELYGSVDEVLDQLIENNNLTGSQILELPRGASIVYYPPT